jgi:hypothetical protein
VFNKKLLELKESLIAVESEMTSIDVTSENFSAESWNSLKEKKATLEIQIEQETIKQKQEDELHKEAKQAVTPAEKIVPEQGISNVTGVMDGFATDPKMGYNVAGELLADHISMELYGRMINDSSDNFRAKRYKHYCQAHNYEHAAGTASTLVDGLEIVPDLLPGVREYGQGEGVNQVLDAFRPLNTSRKEVEYFINEDTYNVDGLVVERVQEGGTFAPQTTSNKLERFRLFKVGVFAKITEEDLQNVPLLESRYMKRAPEVIDVQKVTDIISGTGISMPTGFATSQNDAAETVARGANNVIDYTDLGNLEKQYFRKNGVGMYFTNQTTLAQLTNLQDGSGALIWKENRNNGALDPMFHGTLNGRPLVVSEDMPALGSLGDIALVNPAGYIFAQHVSGVRFAQSMHFYFDADAMAFRWIAQYGGRPAFSNSYLPRNTVSPAERLSHFVLLGANV